MKKVRGSQTRPSREGWKAAGAVIILMAFLMPARAAENLPRPDGGGGKGMENYVIQPGDELFFAIYDEPDTETELRVGAAGTANFLFLGNVKVEGMTVSELRGRLYEAYNKDYYVEPQIQLRVTAYAQRRVQVIGQVNRPGVVTMPPEQEMSIVEAIAAASGFTRLGNPRKVTVKRIMPDGETKIFQVDVNQIMENPEKKDIKVQKGDTIIVPERIF